ncbi:hypothetical protein D3C71_659750 [compost metagenome]
MVHHVLVRFIPRRHFLVIHVISVRDAHDVLRRTGQADEVTGEVIHVGLQFFRRVTFRVDGHENWSHADALLLLQLPADAGHFRQVSRANGGAGHEAEIQQRRLAKTAFGDALAILVGQLERPADVGAGRSRRTRRRCRQ